MNRNAFLSLLVLLAAVLALLIWRPWAGGDVTDDGGGGDPAAGLGAGNEEEVVGGGDGRGQQRRPGGALQPQTAGVFLADGTRAPHFHPPGGGPEVLYSNVKTSGYYLVGDALEEWIDEFQLEDDGGLALHQLNGIEFAYCSEQPDPSRNQGNATLRIYDEMVGGRAPRGDILAEYQLTGLPLGGPDGEVRCWKIRLDLASAGFCDLPIYDDGSGLGFGLSFDSDKTGPLLASGAPGKHPTAVSPQGAALSVSKADADFALRLYGPGRGTHVYAPRDPGPADHLVVRRHTTAQGTHEFRVMRPRRDRDYTLLISGAPDETFAGEGSRLIAPEAQFQDGVVPMAKGVVELEGDLGGNGNVFLQVVEHQPGAYQPGLATAWSQGLLLYPSAQDFLAVKLPGNPERPGARRGAADAGGDPEAAYWWASIGASADAALAPAEPTSESVDLLLALLQADSQGTPELQVAAVLALLSAAPASAENTWQSQLLALRDHNGVSVPVRAVLASQARSPEDGQALAAWIGQPGLDPLLRRAAALGLARLTDPESVRARDVLLPTLQASPDPLDRGTAMLAQALSLSQADATATDAWIQAMLERLRQGDTHDRHWAAAALIEAGQNPAQRPKLLPTWNQSLLPLHHRATDPHLVAICEPIGGGLVPAPGMNKPHIPGSQEGPPLVLEQTLTSADTPPEDQLRAVLEWGKQQAGTERWTLVASQSRVPGIPWPLEALYWD